MWILIFDYRLILRIDILMLELMRQMALYLMEMSPECNKSFCFKFILIIFRCKTLNRLNHKYSHYIRWFSNPNHARLNI